tara:strand:- start:106 stop:282 length:177 start_codon:yes stop_codon:yes gene_type:complete
MFWFTLEIRLVKRDFTNIQSQILQSKAPPKKIKIEQSINWACTMNTSVNELTNMTLAK